jgi:hypothetical protein
MECSIKNCPNPTRTGSSPYCDKHYTRWKRHGDPAVALKDHTPPEIRWKTSYAVDESTQCWNWIGTASRGYGRISCGKNNSRPAHVFVYEQTLGSVPDGLELDHKCRNTLCVNPSHLEPVTHTVNVRRGNAGIHNANKTHCKHGHEFTPENTIFRKSGRQCRTCHQRDMRDYMQKRRAK